MKDYSRAKIYKIVCNISGLVYVGSTCEPTLARRLAKHVASYKQWKNNPANYSCFTSYKIIEEGDYDIVLIEDVKCETKDQLHARERYYIENLVCVNKVIPTRTSKEYQEKHKEHIKKLKHENYEKNKEEILLKNKNYRDDNKDKLSLQYKTYQLNHKEEIKLRKKIYQEKHKEHIKEYGIEYRKNHEEEIKAKKSLVNNCQCGKTYTNCHKSRHERTPYHQNYLKSQNEINDDNLPCSLDGLELGRN
jgi:hypothetical protein